MAAENKRNKLQRKSCSEYKSGIIIITFNGKKIDFTVKFVFLQSPIEENLCYSKLKKIKNSNISQKVKGNL